MEINVSDVPAKSRFEAIDGDGALAGVLTYQLTGPIMACTHTEISPGYDAARVGEALAEAVLRDATAKGRTVVPLYDELRDWLDAHPSYEKVVVRSTRKLK